jgi:hypothetical protein
MVALRKHQDAPSGCTRGGFQRPGNGAAEVWAVLAGGIGDWPQSAAYMMKWGKLAGEVDSHLLATKHVRRPTGKSSRAASDAKYAQGPVISR